MANPTAFGGVEWGRGEAAARQDPPPKCLLLVATGIDQATMTCPHLDGIARDGSTSFLAVRQCNPKDAYPMNQGLRCMGQIINPSKDGGMSAASQTFEKLRFRFMGMHGGVASNCPHVIELGKKVGLCQLGGMKSKSDLDLMAAAISGYLGFLSEGSAEENDRDIAVVHVDTSQPFPCDEEPVSGALSEVLTPQNPSQHTEMWVEWVDNLLRDLDNWNGFLQGVLVCVVLDWPARFDGASQALVPGGESIANVSVPSDGFDFTKVFRPEQSFQFLGVDHVEVDLGRPLLMVQRLKGVTRRDAMDCLSLPECKSAILAEHLLVEIAYKLARSKKYGA